MPQILDWVAEAGLGLPDRDRWAAVEALQGSALRHSFILRHPEHTHRVTFDRETRLAFFRGHFQRMWRLMFQR